MSITQVIDVVQAHNRRIHQVFDVTGAFPIQNHLADGAFCHFDEARLQLLAATRRTFRFRVHARGGNQRTTADFVVIGKLETKSRARLLMSRLVRKIK